MQADRDAQYKLDVRKVVFGIHEPVRFTGYVTDEALTKLNGTEIHGPNASLVAYTAHFQKIHEIARAKHAAGDESPTVKEADV